MKKLLLSLSAIVILGLPKVSAQIINANFETWSADLLVPTAYDPNSGFGSTGWWDLNALNSNSFIAQLGGSPITVYRDSYQPFQGKYCAKIVSQTMTKKSYDTIRYYDKSFNYPQTNGLIFTANISAGAGLQVTPGIPVTGSWSSFSFFYKYYPNGNDTCSCTVAMYHWNSVAKKRELIGGGVWKAGAISAAWTQATVNITYDSTSKADTAFILFSAASLYSNPKVNDSMMIDSSTYGAPVVSSVASMNAPYNNVSIYPNPAQSEINIAISSNYQASKVYVYDITGRSIGTYSIKNNFLTINTQAYNTGLYLYKMLNSNGIQMNVGKFSVVR